MDIWTRKDGLQTGGEDVKRLSFHFPADLHRRLKLAAQKTGMPIVEFLRRAAYKALKDIGL